MKNIKYIVFLLFLLFINVFYVHASCTDEEISNLMDETKKIQITYKHLGEIKLDEGEVYYNYFKLSANNLLDDFYVMLSKNTNKLFPVDGRVETTVYSGNWNFDIYSNKCDKKINTIDVFIPTFNMYSLDPLCEGIDGNDFELCGKYYEYNVGYEDFVQRVTRYREIHNIGESNDDDSSFINLVSKFLIEFFVLLKKYRLYFFIGVIVFTLSIITIVILRKRKKRGVLE